MFQRPTKMNIDRAKPKVQALEGAFRGSAVSCMNQLYGTFRK